MIHSGQCHCGIVKASFETAKTPAELGVRACQCEFCRRHGSLNISDPVGLTTIDASAGDILRYRFALKTADFLLCNKCGVYFAAVTGAGDAIRSTLNIVGLRMGDFLSTAVVPFDYGDEDATERLARRTSKWTPTRFTDAALANSYFGPH